MVAVKRALLFSTGDRYFALLVNFATVAAISRILSPGEIGISVMGAAIVGIALSARDFTSGSYLIQHAKLSKDIVRGAFTIMFALNTAVAVAIAAAAPLVARLSGEEGLVPYLHVISLAVFIEVVPSLITTLLRRDMAFRKVAAINAAVAVVVSLTTLGLAFLGFSFMSFAWAWVAGAAVSMAVSLLVCPYFWMFKPSLRHWREMASFGGYNGATVALYRISEAIPYIFLGRMVSADAAALLQRAIMLCTLPDKVILGGATSVILPAFATETRNGRNIRASYLKALAFITVLQWPALATLALLAHPVVDLLLGSQWHEAVPLVRIVAVAVMFTFSFELNYPVLVSVGAVRDVFMRAVIVFPTTATILAIASTIGLEAVACGFLVAVPFNAFVALWIVSKRISIDWAHIARAVSKSALVTVTTAMGPVLIAAASGFDFAMSTSQAFMAGAFAVAGWGAGLWVTDHPLLAEIQALPLSRRVNVQRD